jgi:hypothetical protein
MQLGLGFMQSGTFCAFLTAGQQAGLRTRSTSPQQSRVKTNAKEKE